MATRDDIRTSSLALIGFLGAVVVVALILLMTVVYYSTADRLDYERRVKEPYPELENLLADQEARLVEYDIQGAMELVVKEWADGVRPGPPPAQAATPAETDAKGAGAEPQPNEAGRSDSGDVEDSAARGDSDNDPSEGNQDASP
jgi:hypothetical protein